MSNLSNIGFPAQTGKEYGQLIALVATDGERIVSEKGVYIKYSDPSGAALYCQVNKKNEILGMNPHFSGKSQFPVSLVGKVIRSESALDGAFHCWAAPTKENDPESGAYPFVFDLPDYYTLPAFNFPYSTKIQLSAFAQNDFQIFPTETSFEDSQKEGIKFPSQSFISIGLFPNNKEENDAPEAYALFNGIIVDCEKRTNKATGKEFYWMLTKTLGGEIDVIADPSLIKKSPDKGNIISGQFWLSGKIIL